MKRKYKKVMVFGAFDRFHTGHQYFLKEAAEMGDELIVVLTPDEIIKKIKGNLPENSFEKREKRIEKENIAKEVCRGDKTLNSWKILKKHKPDIIVLGYDQKELGDALKKVISEFDFKPQIKTVSPYQPEKYHSRFIKHPRKTVRVAGQIQSGKGEANVLGFPTINLHLENGNCKNGIYAGKVHLYGKEYKAAIFIGKEEDVIEAHIIDFKSKESLYGKWAIIEIEEKIREVVRTKSLQEIKDLIKKDVEIVKNKEY